jgi:type I restriction enzyme S subunit
MSEWKETDFGRIPFRWGLKKIIDLKAEDKRSMAMGPFGSNIKAENFVEKGVPVIRGTNLNYSKYVDGDFVYLTEEKADELKASNCKAGDLVFTHRGTIGQVGLIPYSKYPRYVISQSGMKLTVNPKLIDNEFLFYFFKSDLGQFQILKYESQVGVPSISNPLTSLKEIEVPVPPLTEQKSIVSILSSLDDKIDLLHRQNATLEKMAETLFRKWFVEEAKEEWEIVKVGDFVKTNVSSITKNYPHDIIQYLDTSSLTEGNIESLQILKLIEAPSRAKRLVKHNDILISTVRPNQKHYGIVKNPIENLVVSTGFCVIACEKIDPHFIYILLTSQEMTEYLHSIAEGSTSTYPSLKPSDIEAMEFQLPPNDLLTDFANHCNYAWDKISKNQLQIRTLVRMRDTLLPKLISGEVRVT